MKTNGVNNYPKVSNNFGKFIPNPRNNKQPANQTPPKDHNIQNSQTNSKKDQIAEPSSYTVIQTLSVRLRLNQSKQEVPIELNKPKITTKQGLPADIFKKDKFMIKLAARCKFTLVGKFSNTMPKV